MGIIYRPETNLNANTMLKLRKIPDDVTKNVQNVLNTQGKTILDKAIKQGMPVSNRAKQHAKYSDSLAVFTRGGVKGYRNLGFYMQPNGKFWYIKFPNNGSGQSRNNPPMQFVEGGFYASIGKLEALINNAIKGSL